QGRTGVAVHFFLKTLPTLSAGNLVISQRWMTRLPSEVATFRCRRPPVKKRVPFVRECVPFDNWPKPRQRAG
ncbi:hypothetical protein ACI6Q7_28280, partial [Pseudomonas amygdali pv. tabaci]|uniref:hypothetical protein n=1 Tax=Pseudomonas amygdali TaxID=47877 RepID=UPI0039675407